MKISFRRHGRCNCGTGDLTPEAKVSASKKAEDYDQVFSSPVWRCIETAHILSNDGDVQTHEVFADLCSSVGVWGCMDSVRNFLRQFVGNEGKVLVVSHSNLISALRICFEGGKTPEHFDNLPRVPNLEGFDFYV